MPRNQTSSTTTWEHSDLIRDYFFAVFRPKILRRCRPRTVQRYEATLRRFERFVGGRPRLGDIDSKLLDEFEARCTSKRRTSGSDARHQVCSIRTVIRHWNPDSLPPSPPLPEPEPGTARQYFETIYRLEAMIDATPNALGKTRRALAVLREFVGHDPTWPEHDDALAARFFLSLRERGMPPTTINTGYRGTWFAVWNHAARRGLVARTPTVKKLKECREAPDAWTIAESGRILDATLRFRPSDNYFGVPCNHWWNAAFRILWWSALRRGSLMGLLRDDIDLASGTLYIPGERMKNRRGQAFQLGPDAIEAIGRIWLPERPLLLPSHCTQLHDKHFRLILDAAGVKPSRRKGVNLFHKWRRTVCTHVHAAAGIGAASAILGHSGSYVTMRYLDPLQAGTRSVLQILPVLGESPAIAAG